MNIAKWLLFIGLGFIVLALFFYLFGKLPGDIRIKGEKYEFYFPIVTSIVVSIILTIVINLFFYLFRK
jgi:hypothetical protein